MASLLGKVITVTGAGSGIGAATAKLLASRGALLALSDANKANLDRVADGIRAAGNTSITTTAVDVRDRAQVKEWIKSTTDKWGPLDGAANVAGVAGKVQNFSHIWEISTEDYDFINDVNAKGLFHCLAEQLAPGVSKNGSGIVSVASLCGLKGLPRSSAYCGSKHAAVGLIKAAAIEAGPRSIRVNGVAPYVLYLSNFDIQADIFKWHHSNAHAGSITGDERIQGAGDFYAHCPIRSTRRSWLLTRIPP